MKRNFLLCALAFFCLTALLPCRGADRPKRSDAFFGIHLDFHCSLDEQNVGANTTDEMVKEFLDLVNPDFLQIDCKGHPGISSYPTKVGNPCKNIIGDPLKVWRRVTADRGVSLYMHYSGVWDSRATELHPEWSVVNSDGSLNSNATSSFSPYTDKLMIPQLKELALDYGVDGVWVDGDCWGIHPDYCGAMKDAFKKETGIETIPVSANDPNWHTWLEFQRNIFRNRLRHWVDTLNETAPNFECASNWSFTDHMPEPVCANVAFLSGDYSPHDSIATARVSSRFIASQGKPWDLMAWSFAADENNNWKQKGTEQIEREAACVLSQGGGFQAYYFQNRDGSVDIDRVKPMKDIGEFCRARKPYCFRTATVPQVVMIIPTESIYRRVSNERGDLFPNVVKEWNQEFVSAILNNQYSLDIMTDAEWKKHITEYPVAVLSELTWISPEFKRTVADYVRNGGNLYLAGELTSKLFNDIFPEENWKIDSDNQAIKTSSFGKGKIAAFDKNVLTEDNEIQKAAAVQLAYLFPDPAVTVTGSHNVDVSLRRLTDQRLSVQLVNTSGPHRTEHFVQSVDPVGPLTITVKTDARPSKITLQPEGRDLPFEWNKGKTVIKLEKLEIYGIVVFD